MARDNPQYPEPHHQTQFSAITRTPPLAGMGRVLLLCKGYSRHILRLIDGVYFFFFLNTEQYNVMQQPKLLLIVDFNQELIFFSEK